MSTSFIVEFAKTRGAETKERNIRQSQLSIKDTDYQVELFRPASKSARTGGRDETYIFRTENESGKSPWEEAHELYEHFKSEGKQLEYVEPETTHILFDPRTLPKSKMAGSLGYLNNWPRPQPELRHGWHLEDEFSQLKKARDIAAPYFENGKVVKIAHFDTGYDRNHPCLPKNLNTAEAQCFIDGEEGNYAWDVEKGTGLEQQWHGQATLAILAGGYVDSFDGKEKFGTEFGGAPLADVVPLRIADSVALLKTASFAKALDYAVEIGCEVVTMSMAGLPSMRWARAVNNAYEKGVTIVVAAGNSWIEGSKKFLPPCVLYPGRWGRVIAATGIACNKFPYIFEANPFFKPGHSEGLSHSEFMQGNFGPGSAMKAALAAFTPNLPWAAHMGGDNWWSLSGGGTSSATPQVAAAAALWIQRYRKELESAGYTGTWKQVEAVRHALFNSAEKNFENYEKFYGNGALKAADALDPKWFPKESDLNMTERATLFMPLIELFFGSRKAAGGSPIQEEMLMTELLQLAHLEPDLQKLLTLDVSKEDVLERKNLPQTDELMELRFAVKQTNCSRQLKEAMGF